MLDAPARYPRLVVSPDGSRFVRVVCSGRQRDGGPCIQVLGEVNIRVPHDIRYVCRRCGAVYELRNL